MRPKVPVWLLVSATALALRLWLIVRYPALFGGDSVVRLANVDRIYLSYQLPALQSLLWGVGQMTTTVVWFRLLMAAVAAVASVGFLRLARRFLPEPAAIAAALFFATNPFLAAYSTVPYQEMLMLGALCFAGAFWLEGRPAAASVALGLACWTRYEAWLLCPVLVLADLRRDGWTMAGLVRAGLLWGWAPALWMAIHAGLTPEGGYAVEARWAFERFWRWIYLGWIVLKNGWMLLPAALLGGLTVWRQRLWREPRWQALGLFFALFLAAILFSSHGERGQPDRFVTAREAHLLLAGMALLAGLGRLRPTAVALVVGLQWVAADWFVARETSAPAVRLAYEAARFLDEAAGPEDTALALVKPIPPDMLARFLETAERRGDREQAVRTLLELDTSPPDSQRMRVQTAIPRERWVSLSSFPEELVPSQPPPAEVRPEWVVRWSDFRPTNEAERAWAERLDGLTPVRTFDAEGLRVEVFRAP